MNHTHKRCKHRNVKQNKTSEKVVARKVTGCIGCVQYLFQYFLQKYGDNIAMAVSRPSGHGNSSQEPAAVEIQDRE